jgi:WD40 repeat protein
MRLTAITLALAVLAPAISAEDRSARQDPPVFHIATPRQIESVALDARGEYVAVGGDNGWVDIWPLRTGAPLATFRATIGDAYPALVVLLGSPCIAVAGSANVIGDEARTLVVADCATGNVKARVKSAPKSAGNLLNLVALPGCGKVAALYGETAAILDVESGTVIAIDREVKSIAAAANGACVLYAAAKPLKAPKDERVRATLVAFDLKAQGARKLGTVIHRSQPGKLSVGSLGWVAASPHGRTVAASLENAARIDPNGQGDGTTELQIFGTSTGRITRHSLRGVRGVVTEFQYLDEHRLVVQTLDASYVFDRRSSRIESLLPVLGAADEPRVLRAEPQARLLAVGYERTLDIHKIK